jgi:uncharacterized membrane protein
MHVFGVIVWLGGLMFQSAVALPVTQFEGPEAQAAMRKVRRRFVDFVWMSVWTVAITGVLMMLLDPRFLWFEYAGLWSVLLGVKQVVFLFMLFYAFGYARMLRSADSAPSAGAPAGETDLLRHRINQFRAISIALGIAAVLLGAAMSLS